MRNNPMAFFSENVDSWGPLEWFERLAKAVHARSQAVRDKDDIAFETYKNIASSSASRLVSDFEDKVRMALTSLRELEKANVAYVDANTALLRENEALRNLADRLKLEAQGHAMEARGANSTVAEIYQIISGARGEPGIWNGAEPVRKYVGRLRDELDSAACLLETLSEGKPSDDVDAIMMRVMAKRNRAALSSTGDTHGN